MTMPTGFDAYDPACPARLVLEHLTSRWGVLALAALRERTYRFSELRRRVNGVSEKVLAQTLQTLERDGLVLRTAYPEVPPRVEYRLTASGREAAELLSGLVDWVERRMPRIMAEHRRYDARIAAGDGPAPAAAEAGFGATGAGRGAAGTPPR
ncbi:DNA-binding HxlR family transcriptional regulator [Crossiella cryophila]|uniref:DNA-binding HxlR family transcriptional regulator n=2 Tax=Crossiella cryophila TaxID=43355 RepID=A0A7W7FT62_9PSEU|nr:DNA-binding HxlR family transcriptional regulator [Crossiella cryophila]